MHTPTPWFTPDYPDTGYDSDRIIFALTPIHKNRIAVARIAGEGTFSGHSKAKDNAEFIVRACNSHEELLGALKQIVHDADRGVYLGKALNTARAAIKKAGG